MRFTDALLRQDPGPLTSVPVTVRGGGTTTLVVRRLQIVQRAHVRLVTRDALRAAQTEPADACLDAVVELVFDLGVESIEGVTNMCIRYRGIEASGFSPAVLAAVTSATQEFVPDRCTPLQFGDFLPAGTPIAHADVAMSSDGALIELRIDVGTPVYDATDWNRFYGGVIADRRGPRDWSVLVDQRLIAERITGDVQGGIDEYNADHADDFVVHSGPTATWSTPGSKARFDIAMNGDMENLCYCHAWEQDVEISFDIRADLLVENENEITVRMHAESTVEDWFWSACCAQTNMIVWNTMGPYFLYDDEDDDWIGTFIAGLVHLPLVFIGTLIAFGDAAEFLVDGIADEPDCESSGDEDAVCRQPFPVAASEVAGQFTLTELEGVAPGPLLRGRTTPAATLPPDGDLEFEIVPWFVRWDDPCGAARLTITGGLIVRLAPGSGIPAWEVCEESWAFDYRVSDDAPWLFQDHLEVTGNPLPRVYTFDIPVDAIPSSYAPGPNRPLQLFLQTTLGTRIIDFPKLPRSPISGSTRRS